MAVKPKKKFSHDRGNIVLHHRDPSLGTCVIATARDAAWAKILADVLNRNDAIVRMVEGVKSA